MHEYLDRLRLPCLTDAQGGELEREVSLEELQEVLGGMASGKAPGPTGYEVNSTKHILQRFFPVYWKCFMSHGMKAFYQRI
ncbi:hypothetical protein NDU88_007042 [Pleurodeles waltl]|uniref:Uncharacterized protein n=1 Tax=Pleurodeles waltl TaxID=8319 RepID=A0AAV7NV77_PLEWA|nr:hypothetical protein NDU88_007042 [Pleurodeles waltl]